MTFVIDANIAFSAILNTYSKIDTNFIKKRKPMGLKEKIHALIESCDDETALEETYFFLEKSTPGNDWWHQLSAKQQQLTQQSLNQSENGQTISNDDLQKRVWKKFEK